MLFISASLSSRLQSFTLIFFATHWSLLFGYSDLFWEFCWFFTISGTLHHSIPSALTLAQLWLSFWYGFSVLFSTSLRTSATFYRSTGLFRSLSDSLSLFWLFHRLLRISISCMGFCIYFSFVCVLGYFNFRWISLWNGFQRLSHFWWLSNVSHNLFRIWTFNWLWIPYSCVTLRKRFYFEVLTHFRLRSDCLRRSLYSLGSFPSLCFKCIAFTSFVRLWMDSWKKEIINSWDQKIWIKYL